ncbi:MAG TPA: class I SAM-dependent methyltransferase [Planctomycetaceae bacterium]|nr:class I SAM-dependent methyltransferase [Planctomycetaceae bacterium]
MPVTEPDTQPPRFAFGRNWSRFLRTVTEERIAAATNSLIRVFGHDGLAGKRFLDIGCGSGLFSLAAHRLGATVHSFDYDADSVACAEELRHREAASADRWRIERGSVLDAEYLASLGTFDVVYSWGVLHHTGEMWRAIDLAAGRVSPGGMLWIAIYNDQGVRSRVWHLIKRAYVGLPGWLQPAYVVVVGGGWAVQRAVLKLIRIAVGALVRREAAKARPNDGDAQPVDFAPTQRRRGMHLWYDLVDWIGGYPFEVAKPEAILRALRSRGFQLHDLTTCGGDLGCNEFLFRYGGGDDR